MKILCVFFCFILGACASWKNTAVIRRLPDLSENDIMEYRFSITEAQKQLVLGNVGEAKKLYYKCLEIEPRSTVANYQLSNLFLSAGNKEKALFHARMALRYDKDNEWYLLQIAQIYQLLNRNDSTLYIYKRLVQIDPSRYEYLYNLAVLYYQNNKMGKALKTLEVLEKEKGTGEDILLLKYRLFLAKGDNKNCIRILQKAIEKYPNTSKFYGLLGEHYASIKENDLAFQYFTKLLQIDPDNEKGYLSLIDFYRNTKQPSVALKMALDFVSNRDFSSENKVEIISSYLSDRNNFSKYKEDIGRMIDSLQMQDRDNLKGHGLNADFLLKKEDIKGALVELKYLNSQDKKNQGIWEQLLFVYNSLNDSKAVIQTADEALVYFDENPLFYLYKGIACFQLKQFKEAVQDLTAGCRFGEGSKELLIKFYTFLGESYHALKDYEHADNCFEKVIQLDPENVFVLNNYSYYLSLRREKLNLALIYSKRCVQQQPNNSTFLDTYGWVLFTLGKPEEARKILQEAFTNGGMSNAEILEHYAEILVTLKRKDEALKFYRMIKEMGKDSDRLKELLGQPNE